MKYSKQMLAVLAVCGVLAIGGCSRQGNRAVAGGAIGAVAGAGLSAVSGGDIGTGAAVGAGVGAAAGALTH